MVDKKDILEALREHLRILESKKEEGKLIMGGSAFDDEIIFTKDEIAFWEKLE